MITTVCMNPALDKTVTVDSLQKGQVNRIRSSRTDVGGKGVNVAVVARRLQLDAQVIGIAGEDGLIRIRQAMDAAENDFSVELEQSLQLLSVKESADD